MSGAQDSTTPLKSPDGVDRFLTSRQSGRVTFPDIGDERGTISPTSTLGNKQIALATHAESEDEDDNAFNSGAANPFRMPSENDVFLLRDKERRRRKKERKKISNMKIWEKTQHQQKLSVRRRARLSVDEFGDQLNDQFNREDDVHTGKIAVVREDPQFILAVTKSRHAEKESLTEYITKKREMFLLQYALDVKRDEMAKLERLAREEEEKLAMAEQYLEDDAAMFDEFLKENDKNAVEAVRLAERESKLKMEKVEEIKTINARIMHIRGEISKFEEQLKDFQRYQEFLNSLAPPEWLEETRAKQEVVMKREPTREISSVSKAENRKSTLPPIGSKEHSVISRSATLYEEETIEEESDEEPKLYFKDITQVLELFAELEERNLSLIQNSQDTEEQLEEARRSIRDTKAKMEQETLTLRSQIDRLQTAIVREQERARDLETRIKFFSYGEVDEKMQDNLLNELQQKVLYVYKACIGDIEAQISTIQMLGSLENKLEDLFQQIEMLPADLVESVEKLKDKEHRQKTREEKNRQQRIHDEERRTKAQERAREPPRRWEGRRPVFRSKPPPHKRKQSDALDEAKLREEEEFAYFFT